MKSTIIISSAIVGTIVLYQLISLEEANHKRHKELMEKLNILVDGELHAVHSKTKTVPVRDETKAS